jgi:hypothetical protein
MSLSERLAKIRQQRSLAEQHNADREKSEDAERQRIARELQVRMDNAENVWAALDYIYRDYSASVERFTQTSRIHTMLAESARTLIQGRLDGPEIHLNYHDSSYSSYIDVHDVHNHNYEQLDCKNMLFLLTNPKKRTDLIRDARKGKEWWYDKHKGYRLDFGTDLLFPTGDIGIFSRFCLSWANREGGDEAHMVTAYVNFVGDVYVGNYDGREKLSRREWEANSSLLDNILERAIFEKPIDVYGSISSTPGLNF